MIDQNKSVISAVESAIMDGDLSKLNPQERLFYYNKTCESLDLNPLTRPFEYITLNGKLTLYARKDCTDQLRSKRKISTRIVSEKVSNDILTITVEARDAHRSEEEIGCVYIKGLFGDKLANAHMKCITKAKRRATLSLSGLGFTDESELETISTTSFKNEKTIEVKQVSAVPAINIDSATHVNRGTPGNNDEGVASMTDPLGTSSSSKSMDQVASEVVKKYEEERKPKTPSEKVESFASFSERSFPSRIIPAPSIFKDRKVADLDIKEAIQFVDGIEHKFPNPLTLPPELRLAYEEAKERVIQFGSVKE